VDKFKKGDADRGVSTKGLAGQHIRTCQRHFSYLCNGHAAVFGWQVFSEDIPRLLIKARR
jgi:hypothetical protein